MAFVLENDRQSKVNQAGYTASGAPKHVDKRRRYGRTERPSYRGASEHLKRKRDTVNQLGYNKILLLRIFFIPSVISLSF